MAVSLEALEKIQSRMMEQSHDALKGSQAVFIEAEDDLKKMAGLPELLDHLKDSFVKPIRPYNYSQEETTDLQRITRLYVLDVSSRDYQGKDYPVSKSLLLRGEDKDGHSIWGLVADNQHMPHFLLDVTDNYGNDIDTDAFERFHRFNAEHYPPETDSIAIAELPIWNARQGTFSGSDKYNLLMNPLQSKKDHDFVSFSGFTEETANGSVVNFTVTAEPIWPPSYSDAIKKALDEKVSGWHGNISMLEQAAEELGSRNLPYLVERINTAHQILDITHQS